MKRSFNIDSLRARKEPSSVILVEPEYFQVIDQKNPYMKDAIDYDLSLKQWKDLSGIYKKLAKVGILDTVSVMQGAEGLEDMVFCANQSLPWQDEEGRNHVVLSNMRHASRRREVEHFEKFYRDKGYDVLNMPDGLLLEGMGDCIFHPFTSLLWMGHGFRTSPAMGPMLEEALQMPVVPLKLVSEYFYHLDTCFLPVDDRKVLICPDAFDEESLESIRNVFEEVEEVSRREAIDTFCLNAHCIYSRENPVAVIPAGDHSVKKVLKASGYRVIEADTSEFIKSGGSVYCMKMMYFEP